MSTNLEQIRKYIREIIKQELDEASVTGNIDGGKGPQKTPFAFSSKRKKDKKKKEAIARQSGYTVAEAKFAVFFKLGKDGQLGTASILIDAGSKGEAKLKVAKMLKGGQKVISSVRKINMGKAKQIDKKLENVNEGKYHDYRDDESLTPKQKIGRSMREVRDKLNELDALVKMNVRLKNEIGVDSTSYWKRTHGAMKKISERLVKLANKVGQLY